MDLNFKSYSEMCQFQTFEERYEYLKLAGHVGEETFGCDRYLNQILYNTPEWKNFRRDIIIRDNGCDLGIQDRVIAPDIGVRLPRTSNVYIHHINPITKEDVLRRKPMIFDPENVICCSFKTHQAIHYGDSNLLEQQLVERRPNDTCPWR
jgi:hypothetical protein